jgi:hypothetical protein
MSDDGIERLDTAMGEYWQKMLSTPLATDIHRILASGDKKLYSVWLCQVAHLTQHTSAHQALVGTRFKEISHQYMKFCYEHAAEEVGHEMMAVHDLKKIGFNVSSVADLPAALSSTEKLTAYLYHVAQRAHPATRLGFSYWAEKCYPFIQSMASSAKSALGLENHQMSFFVSHSQIDEKHAQDVERVARMICKEAADWQAVETGMINTLDLAVDIFKEIHSVVSNLENYPSYQKFLKSNTGVQHEPTAELF